MACVRSFDFAKGPQGLTVRAALRVRAFFESSMIIALFALAVLMIVGGIASVVQGFPFVRLESGMAMTVAGATTASAGAVVLGLATVASHLRGLGRRLDEMRSATPAVEIPSMGQSEHEVSKSDVPEPAFAMPAAMPALGDGPLRRRPSLGGPEGRDFGMGGMGLAAGLGAAGLDGAQSGAGPHGRGTEPTFVLPPDPDLSAPPPPEPLEPLLPDLLPPEDAQTQIAEAPPEPAESHPIEAHPAEPEPVAAQTVPPEDHRTLALFDTGTDAAVEPVRPYSGLDTMADVTPEPVAEPVPATVEDKPDVVGTYASGGNTYVMYANGSIEAETPRGRFNFDSLEELKAFVEAGGETDARGAA